MGTSGSGIPGTGGSLIGKSSGSGSGNGGLLGSGNSPGRGIPSSSLYWGAVDKRHNQHNDENQTKKSGRSVAPAAIMWPGRNRTDEKQYENDEQDGGQLKSPTLFV